MREIIFRGKWLCNDEWAYGYLSHNFEFNEEVYIFPKDRWDSPWFYAVDPSTVGQFTGKNDKNGLNIFEGDIIKSRVMCAKGGYVKSEEKLFIVKYLSEQARFLACMPNNMFHPTAMNDCEVVGNIHDNPEMLEVENE